LLGLPEEEVLTQYEKSPDATPAPVQIPAALGSIRETRRPLPTWVRWLVLAIILVAGITTLVNLRSNDIEPKEQDGLISKPVGTTRDGSIASGDSTAAQGPLAESTSPLQALMNNAASAGELTIRFNFSGESWVEVYDAQNHQVLHEMGTANTTREISAAPPLRVVLGASAMVKVNVNSRDIEIPASAVQANVAKFEVKADGSLK
jgi:cytoskeletal protein RodZ